MAQALHIEDYISPLPSPEGWGEIDFDRDLPELQARNEELARLLTEFESSAGRIVSGAERLVAESKANPPANLDEIIRGLQELEIRPSWFRLDPVAFAQAREKFGQRESTRSRLRALTLVRRFEDLAARFEELSVAQLEALRDARWQLMALRAEKNRADEQRVGFDGSQSLQDLLAGAKT
jgi:hypothetical protein